jgi:hypothetical protein
MKIEIAQIFFVKFSNTKFNEVGLSFLELLHVYERTDDFNRHSAGSRAYLRTTMLKYKEI